MSKKNTRKRMLKQRRQLDSKLQSNGMTLTKDLTTRHTMERTSASKLAGQRSSLTKKTDYRVKSDINVTQEIKVTKRIDTRIEKRIIDDNGTEIQITKIAPRKARNQTVKGLYEYKKPKTITVIKEKRYNLYSKT